jgi:hypothetical protein
MTACNGFTASTVPATGLRAVGLRSAYPHLVFSLIMPAPRSAASQSTGKLSHRCRITAILRAKATFAPFRTSPLSDVYPPAFELREPRYARQQNIGGFIECRVHHIIARPRDPASDVLFSRLVLPRREAEQRPCGLRLRDAIGIIHRRFAGYCNQWTHARHRHQSPTDRVVTDDREHRLVQLFVFRLQSYPRRKHRPGDAFQGGLARHQRSITSLLVMRMQPHSRFERA